MFILIPSILVILGLSGIGVIVYRKLPYLNKLSPEAHDTRGHIVHDFFPEIKTHLNQATIKSFQKDFLHELEKLVRRLRVVTLKVDHLSDRAIKKLRKFHVATHVEHTALLEEQAVEAAADAPIETDSTSSQDDLKAREQQLIVEIAQSPREVKLYEELGDLYIAMHNIGEAKESYEAALALSPHDPALARKYSQLLKKDSQAVV